jgi:fatty acid desaturase
MGWANLHASATRFPSAVARRFGYKAVTVELVLRDPTYEPARTASLVECLAERFIHDRRDVPFLKVMVVQSATVIPTGLALYAIHPFRWWLAGVHLALVIYFLGPFVLMLHNTSHRRLFRRPWSWINYYIPWVLGPFFGESPEAYFTHHVGMHHPENNLEADLSSTLPYRRDHLGDFLCYFSRFFFTTLFELTKYFARKGRRALMARTLIGELSFCTGVAMLLFVDWRATLVVFVVPFVVTRFGMMAGNWAQHAFVDEASPENNYRNSITCINCVYNRRCFNDGYHIGHHLKATRHWTEMPTEFGSDVATYAAQNAVVFEGVDFFGVWFCLMLRRYDWLARRFVQLGDSPRSEEEIIALLRSRTRWTRAAGASGGRDGSDRASPKSPSSQSSVVAV